MEKPPPSSLGGISESQTKPGIHSALLQKPLYAFTMLPVQPTGWDAPAERLWRVQGKPREGSWDCLTPTNASLFNGGGLQTAPATDPELGKPV